MDFVNVPKLPEERWAEEFGEEDLDSDIVSMGETGDGILHIWTESGRHYRFHRVPVTEKPETHP